MESSPYYEEEEEDEDGLYSDEEYEDDEKETSILNNDTGRTPTPPITDSRTREELLSDFEQKEKRDVSFAALSVLIVVIVIGLPVWWKTTQIYRASLPYSDIAELSIKLPVRTLNVKLYLYQGIEDNVATNFGWKIEDRLKSDMKGDHNLFHITVNVHSMSEVVKKMVSQTNNTHGLDVLYNEHLRANKAGENISSSYDVLVLPSEWMQPVIYIGEYRTIFITQQDESAMLSALSDVFINKLLNYKHLERLVTSLITQQLDKPVRDMMREVKSKAAYDLVFTLIHPDPPGPVRWNIDDVTKDVLQPFLSALGETFANFTIESQVIYYASIGVKPKRDKATGQYYISDTHLPHIINPIESRLGSQLSLSPTLNFVTYIPAASHTPLYIKHATGMSESFLSARWGGVTLYNMNQTGAEVAESQDGSAVVDVRGRVMPTFIGQLKQLLGAPSTPPHHLQGLEWLVAPYQHAPLIHEWEIDYLYHRHLVEHTITSTSTLSSLAGLLEKIGNIVISDHVAQHVFDAVSCLHSCYEQLQDEDLISAYSHARAASLASEKAFFDPSILELLYFPEDQKFAIYVPLFVPVGMPLVISAIALYRYVKRNAAHAPAQQPHHTTTHTHVTQ